MLKRRTQTGSEEDIVSPEPKRRKEDGSHPMDLTHSDYTVGWLCALPKEQTAAKAMLDQIHSDLRKPQNDSNSYTLGSIDKHNIVIACLPKGKIGTNAAATFATQMVRTFPSIKVGLMVGIGGGIPPKVRLGDVVVSTPTGEYPGVVQWDLGKAEKDGVFKRTGALNNPPNALLTALTKLETDHEMAGSKIPEYLEELKQKWPRLVPKYIRSELHQDPVSSDISDRITGDVHVHYGLIASGNQVIKDAKLRDTVNSSLGGHVLCVEMEAAGLMDFPCIVIRGICDYADSQKNDHWQEHAAAVGAAFAKEFLQYVQPSEVEGELPVKDILNQVHHELTATRNAVKKIEFAVVNGENRKILNWLTLIDYGPQQSDYFGRRQPATGKWLLDSTQFRTWRNARGRTLFCPGIPGAGKTILTSIVVDNLQVLFRDDNKVGIAYIYCNFRRQHEQTATDLLASLLKQLAQCLPTFPESVTLLYEKHKFKRSRPSLEEISNTVTSIVELYSRVFIIIDALDECSEVDNTQMKFLDELFSLQNKTEVNIFATSRPLLNITERFKGDLSLDISATREDVKEYLKGHMIELRSFVQADQQLQEYIKAGISEAVDGMFLLAHIYLLSLNDKVTRNAVIDALDNMKKQKKAHGGNMLEVLKNAYGTAVERIQEQKLGLRELAIKVLSWITCAKRPLTTSELQHALAIKTGRSELDYGDMVEIGDMVSVCAGLVTVDKRTNIIRLAHHTTQIYFEGTREILFQNPEADITRTCVTYLSLNKFDTGFCDSDKEFEERMRLNVFYKYAAHHWGDHAREGPGLCEEVLDFLRSKKKVESSIQALMVENFNIGTRASQTVPKNMTEVHLVAYFGIISGADLLVSTDNVNLEDSYGRTAITYAIKNRHEALVKLLLEKGADIESEDEFGRRLLWQATDNRHEAVIKLLLDNGAEVDAEDKYGHTPLLEAARNGHKPIVKLLLNKGAGVDAEDKYGHTSLWHASINGYEPIVKLLLNKGAEVNIKDNDGYTPLLEAVIYGRETIVRLLLNKGAKVDVEDKYGRGPLGQASGNGNEAIVKLLLDKGADIEFRGHVGWTALGQAAKNGHEAIVKVLIEQGADIEVRDKGGRTSLWHASRNGHGPIVELLLDNGAQVDAGDENGRTPLLEAAENGHETIVKLLIDKGADIEAKFKRYGQTALWEASSNGHEAIVKLLIDKGGDIHVRNNYVGRRALGQASRNGHEAIVKLLIDKGADIEFKDHYVGRTALEHASSNGHVAIVKLLLDKGADIEAKAKRNGQTALWQAAENGHDAVVKLLIDNGADIEVMNNYISQRALENEFLEWTRCQKE